MEGGGGGVFLFAVDEPSDPLGAREAGGAGLSAGGREASVVVLTISAMEFSVARLV